MSLRVLILLVFGMWVLLPSRAQSPAETGCDALAASLHCKLLDDFESDTIGTPPHHWRTTKNRGKLVRLTRPDAMDAKQHVRVRSDSSGDQFARIYTKDQAFRVVLSHRNDLNWHLDKRPHLRWSWRAKTLPKGANERYDRSNDTGGALYVTFDTDWLGRPKSIKYTYSSTLPVGTTVDYGPLKVLVVASKAEQGAGKWITHERNVVDDYKRLFGEAPDKTPLAIMMWSDSDTMHSVGTIDFDDLLLLSDSSRSESATASSQ